MLVLQKSTATCLSTVMLFLKRKQKYLLDGSKDLWGFICGGQDIGAGHVGFNAVFTDLTG